MGHDSWTADDMVRAVEPTVRRYCTGRTGTLRDPALSVEDVIQETLAAVAGAARDRWEQADDLRGYACGVARNKIVDAYRTSGRHRAREFRAGDPEPTDPTPGPQECAERAERAALVRRLLALLPDHQASVLRHRVLEGRSAPETAALLGTTPGAVRVAQHRALATLREELGRLGPSV